MTTNTTSDRAAVTLSFLCILHCLALPALAVVLPFLAVAAEAEWVHWLFAILAIIASGTVALSGPAARTPIFLVPAGLGIALLLFGLAAEHFGIEEAIPTVAGGVLLAFAHINRMRRGHA